jgi:hypothetical protein
MVPHNVACPVCGHSCSIWTETEPAKGGKGAKRKDDDTESDYCDSEGEGSPYEPEVGASPTTASSRKPGDMKIFVNRVGTDMKIFVNSTFTLYVMPSDTIDHIKELVEKATSIPSEWLTLLSYPPHQGKAIEDGTLSSHSLKEGSRLSCAEEPAKVLSSLYGKGSRRNLFQAPPALVPSDGYCRPLFLALGLNTNDNFLETRETIEALQNQAHTLSQTRAVVQQIDLKEDILRISQQVEKDAKSLARKQQMCGNRELQEKYLSSKEKKLPLAQRLKLMDQKLVNTQAFVGDEFRALNASFLEAGRLTGKSQAHQSHAHLQKLVVSLIEQFVEPIYAELLAEVDHKVAIASKLLTKATNKEVQAKELPAKALLRSDEDRAIITKERLWNSDDKFKRLLIEGGENYDDAPRDEEIREQLEREVGRPMLAVLESHNDRFKAQLTATNKKGLRFLLLRKGDVRSNPSEEERLLIVQRKLATLFFSLVLRSVTVATCHSNEGHVNAETREWLAAAGEALEGEVGEHDEGEMYICEYDELGCGFEHLSFEAVQEHEKHCLQNLQNGILANLNEASARTLRQRSTFDSLRVQRIGDQISKMEMLKKLRTQEKLLGQLGAGLDLRLAHTQAELSKMIEKVYRKKMLQIHPDRLKRAQTAAEKKTFEAMKLARDVLSDVAEREEYFTADNYKTFMASRKDRVMAAAREAKADEAAAARKEAKRREEESRQRLDEFWDGGGGEIVDGTFVDVDLGSAVSEKLKKKKELEKQKEMEARRKLMTAKREGDMLEEQHDEEKKKREKSQAEQELELQTLIADYQQAVKVVKEEKINQGLGMAQKQWEENDHIKEIEQELAAAMIASHKVSKKRKFELKTALSAAIARRDALLLEDEVMGGKKTKTNAWKKMEILQKEIQKRQASLAQSATVVERPGLKTAASAVQSPHASKAKNVNLKTVDAEDKLDSTMRKKLEKLARKFEREGPLYLGHDEPQENLQQITLPRPNRCQKLNSYGGWQEEHHSSNSYGRMGNSYGASLIMPHNMFRAAILSGDAALVRKLLLTQCPCQINAISGGRTMRDVAAERHGNAAVCKLLTEFGGTLVGRSIVLGGGVKEAQYVRVLSFAANGVHTVERTDGSVHSLLLVVNEVFVATAPAFTVVNEVLFRDETMRQRAIKSGSSDGLFLENPHFRHTFMWNYTRGDASQYGVPDYFELQIKRWGLKERENESEDFEYYPHETVYSGEEREYTLSAVQALPGGIYEARVRAVNEVGRGDWSFVTEFQMHLEGVEYFAGTASCVDLVKGCY